jgi:predicted ATPase
MITRLKVSGFKSLNKFDINLNRGLNVLIGPNGAGKSNICQALGMIASAAQGTLSRYMLSLGGTTSVFTYRHTEGNAAQSTNMNIFCEGETEIIEPKEPKISLKYTYQFLLEKGNQIIIKKESLTISRKNESTNRYKAILKAYRHPPEVITIENIDKDLIGPMPSFLLKGERAKHQFQIQGEQPDSLMQFLSTISFFCHKIREDLRFSRAWNIDPHIAKKSSDILEPRSMLSDGRWFPNALEYLFKNNHKAIIETNEFLQRVLPRYKEVRPKVSEDGSTRSYELLDLNDIPCPAASLSDGTIKILALMIGIFSQKDSTSIIEEPENYLHPWAAKSLISFFRDHFTDGVCILTTHSETILNEIKPEEIIVIENINGITKQRRIPHENKLYKAIKDSGFGCGYHYISGAIGGTPV